MLKSNHFSNASGSRIITNLKADVRDDVYCFLYPEEYALPERNESDSHSASSTRERKSLKKISREKQCSNSNFIHSR